MEVHVDFDELNTLELDLGKADARAVKKASVAVRKVATDIEGTAKTLVPVDTGATKNSIFASAPHGAQFNATSLIAEIGPTTEYAPHLEYGTVHMAPRAFMGPALDYHGWELGRALEQIAEGTFG